MAGNILEAHDADFSETIQSAPLVLVDFWAPWCGPCRRVAPIIEELSTEMDGNVRFVKLNTDENPETAGRYGVMSIPTLMVFKGGQKVDQLIGAHPKENIVSVLKKHQ